MSGPLLCYLKSDFRIYFTEMITILRRCVASNIWVATLKVKVTAWPCSKQHWPAHNFVIWSRILQLLDRNDHYIEKMCQYLAHSLALCILYCIILSSVFLIANKSSVVYKKKKCVHFVHRNYIFLSESWLIINGNKQELMIIKELFEGTVGDYCIARNTIKCLF